MKTLCRKRRRESSIESNRSMKSSRSQKKILVKTMNGRVVIRVGGGYMQIQDYIKKQMDNKNTK